MGQSNDGKLMCPRDEIKDDLLRLMSMKENWEAVPDGKGYIWVFRQRTSGISTDPANIPYPWTYFS